MANSSVVDLTLVIGKDVSLTLGSDSLNISDSNRERGQPDDIPFYNVLWAELSHSDFEIQYALLPSKQVAQPMTLKYSLESLEIDRARASNWIEILLERSYKGSQRQKRAYVMLNPNSGAGKAATYWHREIQPIFAAAQISMEVVTTKAPREAIDLMEKLDIDAYDIIVSCSGDGLVHEIFNGLGKRPDARKAMSKIAVTHAPCGTGNGMCLNLNGTVSPSVAALAIVKGLRMPLDLVSITQAFGLIADVNIGTEHLRWMGGARYNYGIATRVFSRQAYPCQLAVKVAIEDKAAIKAHYQAELTRSQSKVQGAEQDIYDGDGLPPLKYGTINDPLPEDWEAVDLDTLWMFYCGNMAYVEPERNLFPAALPNDGLMDIVLHDAKISVVKAVAVLLSIPWGTFFDKPSVSYRKIHAFRLIPKGYAPISFDGEGMPPEPFQAEIHPGLGTVLSKNGYSYENPGPG